MHLPMSYFIHRDLNELAPQLWLYICFLVCSLCICQTINPELKKLGFYLFLRF